MSLMCNFRDLFFESFYPLTGYRFLTNEEYEEELKLTVRELSELRRKNLMDNESFSYLAEICVAKLVENRLDSMFSLDPNAYRWVTQGRKSNEKFVRK